MIDPIWLILTGLLGGGLMGVLGVGGVIVVPILTVIFSLPAPQAIATTLIAFMLSAPVSILIYSRAGSIPWRSSWWIYIGALAGALPGAFTVVALSDQLLKILIAAMLAFGGLRAFIKGTGTASNRQLRPPAMLAIGLVTGYLSALTGTGGAVTMMPILLALDVAVLPTIGMAQAVQIPLTAIASLSNLYLGTILWQTGLILAASLALGHGCGAFYAHRLPTAALMRWVSVTMIASGGLMLAILFA